MQVKVFYLCDHGVRESFDPGFNTSFAWDVPLTEGYEFEFLRPGFSPRHFSFWEMDSPDIAAKLDAYRPHAIWVHGYGQRFCWRAVQWAQGKTAVIYFGDSELLHSRSLLSKTIKRLVLPWFFNKCDAFLTIGDNNEQYYRHYGVADAKLYRGVCPVDVRRFRKALEGGGRIAREDMKRKLDIPEGVPVVVTVGKLESRKRPLDLVEAIALLKRRGVEVCGLFIGEGALRSAIEQRCGDLGLENNIRITGFVNQSEMPFVLEAGDINVMMSDFDPHPLAVTEGLIAGLPVVISDKVGCVGPTDTAQSGVNALVYPCGDVRSLADAINLLVTDSDLRERMGKESLAIAKSQDVPVAVRVLVKIVVSSKGKLSDSWDDLHESLFQKFSEYLTANNVR